MDANDTRPFPDQVDEAVDSIAADVAALLHKEQLPLYASSMPAEGVDEHCRERAVRALAALARLRAVGGSTENSAVIKNSDGQEVELCWGALPTRWHMAIEIGADTIEIGATGALALEAVAQKAAAEAREYLRATQHLGAREQQ